MAGSISVWKSTESMIYRYCSVCGLRLDIRYASVLQEFIGVCSRAHTETLNLEKVEVDIWNREQNNELLSSSRFLPCPYCGAYPRYQYVISSVVGNSDGYRVRCSSPKSECPICPEFTHIGSLDTAIEIWNSRALAEIRTL